MFPVPGPKLDGHRRRLVISYAPDWIVSIVLLAAFYALETVSGYKRQFSLDDKTLQFPFAVHERIPDPALFLICFVAPFCLLPTINYLTVRSKWDWHTSVLGLVFGISLTSVVTEVIKITVGRPRPDLISRCMPKPGSVDPPVGLSTSEICTQTDFFIFNDGWRSFPSGHSSLSFAGLGFLSFYVAGKLHLFDGRGHTIKIWLALIPLVGAALVAISRTMDYRHHWQDVFAGSALGFILAYLAYRQYYPSLRSETCHEPYPPRLKLIEPVLLPIHLEEADSLELLRSHENGYSQPIPYQDDEEERGQVQATQA